MASAEGYLYVYNLDSTEGGDCTLLKQHRFVLLQYNISNLIHISSIILTFNYFILYITSYVSCSAIALLVFYNLSDLNICMLLFFNY